MNDDQRNKLIKFVNKKLETRTEYVATIDALKNELHFADDLNITLEELQTPIWPFRIEVAYVISNNADVRFFY